MDFPLFSRHARATLVRQLIANFEIGLTWHSQFYSRLVVHAESMTAGDPTAIDTHSIADRIHATYIRRLQVNIYRKLVHRMQHTNEALSEKFNEITRKRGKSIKYIFGLPKSTVTVYAIFLNFLTVFNAHGCRNVYCMRRTDFDHASSFSIAK